jgi:hypothetical protein
VEIAPVQLLIVKAATKTVIWKVVEPVIGGVEPSIAATLMEYTPAVVDVPVIFPPRSSENPAGLLVAVVKV